MNIPETIPGKSITPVTRLAFMAVATVFFAGIAGCSGGDNATATYTPEQKAPFQELYDQGIDRYLGKYTPMLAETEGDVVTHTFGKGDGPLCLFGKEYRMATRDMGSRELMIVLRGGGSCTSQSCFLAFPAGEAGIPKLGILDPERNGNPVAAWNTAYLPYCDGGLFVSDVDTDSDGDGQIDRFQRGLHNLSAALDVVASTFPSPSRILLSGVSAGGFGASFALPLVRKLYPDVPIDLINDSGIGLFNPDEPQAVAETFKEWNAAAFFPASCTSCIGPAGYLTDFHKWELGQDANFRLGMLSFNHDQRISKGYGGYDTNEEFELALEAVLSDIETAYPERMHSFTPDGLAHTFLLDGLDIRNALDVTAGGVSAMDWITAMLNDSPDWVSVGD
ncbi:MAG: vtpJ-therm [Halioglobus sp.]|nr:vtpJ-therm [Halioglobus sp.]